MHVPEDMKAQRRWMVRVPGAKAPRSVLPRCPETYKPGDREAGPNHWRTRWNQSCVWGTYAQACAYWRRHEDKIAGLNFINHYGISGAELAAKADVSERRIVVVDVDNAFDKDGNLWEPLRAYVDLADTYAEISMNKGGLHVIQWVDCPPLSNRVQIPLYPGDAGHPCKIDVLFSGNTAFTGDLLPGCPNTLATVALDLILSTFHVKQTVTVEEVSRPDWWSEPEKPLDEGHEPLIDLMTSGKYDSIEGEGGDHAIYSAACELMRHGVTGWQALRLLQHVPADPEWSEPDLRRKVDTAYSAVQREGRFGVYSLEESFDTIETGGGGSEEAKDRIYDLGTLIGRYKRGELARLFLVEGALCEGPPTVIVGEKKSLKTSIAIDLMISLETQTDWLNHFHIAGRRNVLYFGAETDAFTMTDLAKRILEGRGLPFEEHLYRSIKTANFVPPFHAKTPKDRDERLNKIKGYLKTHQPQVVIFDPLYLGMSDVDLGNLFEVGGALEGLHEACREMGAWLILIHHAKRMNEFRPLTLNDIYGAGVGEWAGQWILVSRQREMEAGTHKLYMRLGGRAGDFGLWDLHVVEGEVDAICTERRWEVSLSRITEEGEQERFAMQVLKLIPDGEPCKMAHFDILPYPKIQIQRALLWLHDKGKIQNKNGVFSRCDSIDLRTSNDF